MSLPTQLGRYEILSLLGQGAMGAVYKARDPVLDRAVALKTVIPVLVASQELRDEYRERFQREAKAAGRLSHPSIVSVHDLGFDEATATPFIVMEYVAGVSLETVLKENPTMPVAQAMGIVEQVATALEEAHRHGVVHRDIKPANVLFDDRGRVKVADFGVARLEGSELTQAGVGLGTPGYLAPEVVQGGVAGPSSDVFALGVLAYRLFTGQKPFEGATREALAIDVLQREPIPPGAIRAELPEHASNAVMRALAKSPDARTPSADAFSRELRAGPATHTALVPPAEDGKTTTVRTEPRVAASATPVARRRRWWVLLGAFTAAAVLGVGALLASREPRPGTPPGSTSPPTETASTVPTRPAADRPARSPDALRKAEERARELDKEAVDKPRGEGKKDKRGKGRGRGKGKGRD